MSNHLNLEAMFRAVVGGGRINLDGVRAAAPRCHQCGGCAAMHTQHLPCQGMCAALVIACLAQCSRLAVSVALTVWVAD